MDLLSPLALALAVLAAVAAARVVPGYLREVGVDWRVLLAGLAGIAVLRGAFVEHSFVHDNFHSFEIIDQTLGVGASGVRYRAYGPVGYHVLGTLAPAFGGGASGVFRANGFIGLVLLVPFAGVVARVFGGAKSAYLAVAALALFVPHVRIVASEEMHTVAALFGWTGLLLLDAFVRHRSRLAGVGAVAALIAMLFTRQSFFPWAPACFLIVAWVHGFRPLRTWQFWVAGGLVAGVLGVRVLGGSDGPDGATYTALLMSFREPTLFAFFLGTNPLFEPLRYSAVFLPLLVLGLFRPAAGRASMGVVLLGLVIITLPFFRPNPGADLSMRYPVFLVAAAFAGAGAAWLIDKVAGAWGEGAGRATLAGSVLAVVFIPLLLPGRVDLRYASIEYQEYRYLESIAHRLPETFVVVKVPREGWGPDIHLPRSAFGSAAGGMRELELERIGSGDQPQGTAVFFYAGLNCWAYSLPQLLGMHSASYEAYRDSPHRAEFDRYMLGEPIDDALRVDEIRTFCAEVVGRGRLADIPEGRLETVDVIPFAHFGGAEIPLRWYRLEDGH